MAGGRKYKTGLSIDVTVPVTSVESIAPGREMPGVPPLFFKGLCHPPIRGSRDPLLRRVISPSSASGKNPQFSKQISILRGLGGSTRCLILYPRGKVTIGIQTASRYLYGPAEGVCTPYLDTIRNNSHEDFMA
jgi:hypothetical protein